MRRFLFATLIVVLAGCAARGGTAAQQRPDPPPYNILVSNDDGVRAPGIAAVAQVLQAIGNVIIVAPAENQSGKGHSIVTSEPVVREDLTLPNGMKAIGLTATPASTVNIAIRNIVRPKPDLVVSGINRGYNLAYSVYLSGTAGAAREGAMHGIPAIAASLDVRAAPRDFVAAAEEVLGVARRVKQYGLPASTFLNVNIPGVPAGGYRGYYVTTQERAKSGSESFVEFTDPSDRKIYRNQFEEPVGGGPPGSDSWAVQQGYVSVTPMRVGEEDSSQMDTWRQLFKP